MSPPTTEDGKQRLARLFDRARTTKCCSIPRRPCRSASRSARIPRSRPGTAISGRSAAARPGAGISYDPETNLFYYGTANPSTWNPVQRAGPDGKPIDQKWTMSIIARNADTGMARWAYQMTPFDQWDYDGVNEMILADIDVRARSARRSCTSTATVWLYARSRDGRAAGGREVRPGGQLDHRRR